MADISPEAESLFAEYLAHREAGECIAFETWVVVHPQHEADLRALHAYDQDVAAQLGSALPSPTGRPLSFFRPGRGTGPTGVQTSHQGSALRPGDHLGDFQLIEIAGTGGMGQVWEAEEVPLGRRVALKVVLPARVDSRSLELFVREARAGGRLSHPGIVRVNGFGETDGVHWFNEELVEGSWTLRGFIDEMRNAESLRS